VYKPKQAVAGMAADEKSFAVRLTLASNDATLTDEQIEAAVAAIVGEVGRRTGARLRG
jgi:phenylalanyl-tRNA synthetase beta chain